VALQAARDWPKATARQAWLLATRADAANRNGPLAVLQAQIAQQALPEPDAEVLDALAAAYAETGRFPDAVAAAKQALALSSVEQKEDREKRLQLYEKSQPFREATR
jgi:Flp pilus assembly protein TadD